MMESELVMTSGSAGGGAGQTEAQRDVIAELIAERDCLDNAFVHSRRLICEEIERLKKEQAEFAPDEQGNVHLTEKVFVNLEDNRKHNLVGRLLGPKGLTLKRMQVEANAKMSILGRGSSKDKSKEEELVKSDDPAHAHLKEELHVLVEVTAQLDEARARLAAGVAEVKKMLVPPVPGSGDPVAARYRDREMPGYNRGYPMPLPPPPPMRGMGGRGPRGGGGGGKMMGRGGGDRGRGQRGRGRGRGGHRGGKPQSGGYSDSSFKNDTNFNSFSDTTNTTGGTGNYGNTSAGSYGTQAGYGNQGGGVATYNSSGGYGDGYGDSYGTTRGYGGTGYGASGAGGYGTSSAGYGAGYGGDWKPPRQRGGAAPRYQPY